MLKKLSRKSSVRNRLIQNLLASLILYEKIKTTQAKSKLVKSAYERMERYAKVKNIDNIRRLIREIGDKDAAMKLFSVSGKSFPKLRILKLGNRGGDDAPIVQISIEIKSDVIEEKEKRGDGKNKN
ncbi:hypothetical protein COT77_00535 [Candidatus Berkelbacteria bacterium CG10_big_fil_rev_8_21_14_0_10_41_12]|uniref:50S ribosomal protein L17 n=1 Tax=Candidatus Berkelbacteria bacterium CG10_big_fil_rev_8_21_14_0_10_41_12 TaxID=1974513 RepID=A0A2M6WXQ9_9BACT|nr:MAG: hypothetical protein COT77_00535 [Candidatus Berkelbacteria bacterium CG10_big_fil_rev_8_21_14_0_10_41_12]